MTIVLSNLGREDLLNCRLVCHIWNKECLKYLRKSKYTLPLDLERITSYIEYTNINPNFVLPFYIDLNMHTLNDPHQFVPLYKLDKFNKNLKLLINRFGSESVVSLKLSLRVYDNDRYGEKRLIFLAQLFFIVSTGLKILNLRNIYFDPEAMKFFISTIKQRNFNFPNLKTLKVKNLTEINNTLHTNTPNQFILENSPILENLKVMKLVYPSINSTIRIPFEKLKSLKIGSIYNPSDLLRNIQECQVLPVLEKLKIGLSDIENENEIYHDILESFSKTIEILAIELISPLSFVPLTINFPKLLVLSITCRRKNIPIFLNPYKIKFNPERFPNLQCINIPNGYIFIPEDSLEQQLSARNILSSTSLVVPIITNVKKLTISVYDFNYTPDVKSMFQLFQKYMEHLQSVFPNVTSVAIVDKCNTEKHHVKQLINELIQSDLASNIRDITLWNFEHDYLGQVLKQLGYQPGLILENVETNFKYEQKIQNDFQSCTGSSDLMSITSNVLDEHNVKKQIIIVEEKNKPVDHKMTNIREIAYEQDGPRRLMKSENVMVNELDLTMMVKHFPNLRQIGISSYKFDQDKQKCSEQIQNLRIQFPNITVNMV